MAYLLVFFWLGGASETSSVSGPGWTDAGLVYASGPDAGLVYVAGPDAGLVHVAGPDAGYGGSP